jgi:preprotein translocase subunit SecE
MTVARISTRRPEEDEEDLVEDVAEEEDEEEQVSAPAVSDRRRRRQLKRGETVAEVEAAPQPTRSKERPTPSQRAERVESSNPVVRFFQGVLEYFREVKAELDKVTWLSREDVLRLTYIVIIVTTVSALFLGLVSYIFGLLTQALAGGSSIFAGAVTILLILGVAGAWLFRDSLFSRFE